MGSAIHKVEHITDLRDMLYKSRQKFKDLPAYKFKTDKENEFRIITYKELTDDVNYVGTVLVNLGLKNKRIAVISENRYEWAISYLGICTGTGVVVPLDRSLPDNEIEDLLIRSEVEGIIYSKNYDKIIDKIKKQGNTNLKRYISMDLEKETLGILSLDELKKAGKELVERGNVEFIDVEINKEEMAFMLFTSGTTALSKAVMLSHRNICSNIIDIGSVIKLDTKDTLLSFLPLHHTFECTVGFLYPLYAGSSIAFCDGVRHIAENIKEYQITAMISVPILFETMYKKVMKSIEKKGKLKKVQKGIKITKALRKIGIDIRKKIFSEIHDTLGGKVRLFVSGGAALDPMVEEGFNDLGFRTVQGYGLTETSPVLAAGNDKYVKIGSIGRAFPSAEILIDNPDENGIGELIVKAPYVMLGYHNNKEETDKVLKNGWFHTGDLAYIDSEEFIFITGRKKNVVVLKNGKNIFPEEIETLINRLDGVKESFVYGKLDKDGDVTICAKIVYDKDIVEEVYGKSEDKEIYEFLWGEVKKINKNMPVYKYVRELIVTQDELIKTTTQKIKRHEELNRVLKEK